MSDIITAITIKNMAREAVRRAVKNANLENGKKYALTVDAEGQTFRISGVYDASKNIIKMSKGLIFSLKGARIIDAKEDAPKPRTAREEKIIPGTIAHWLKASKQIK